MSFLSISGVDFADVSELMHQMLDLRNNDGSINLAQAETSFAKHLDSIMEKFKTRVVTINDTDMRRGDFIMAKNAVCNAVFHHVVAHAKGESEEFGNITRDLSEFYSKTMEDMHELLCSVGNRLNESKEDFKKYQVELDENKNQILLLEEQLKFRENESATKDTIIDDLRKRLSEARAENNNTNNNNEIVNNKVNEETVESVFTLSDLDAVKAANKNSYNKNKTNNNSIDSRGFGYSNVKDSANHSNNSNNNVSAGAYAEDLSLDTLRLRLRSEQEVARAAREAANRPNRKMPWDPSYTSTEIVLKADTQGVAAKKKSFGYGMGRMNNKNSSKSTNSPKNNERDSGYASKHSHAKYAASIKWNESQLERDEIAQKHIIAVGQWVHHFRIELKEFMNEQEVFKINRSYSTLSPLTKNATSKSGQKSPGFSNMSKDNIIRVMSQGECIDLIIKIYASKEAYNGHVGLGSHANPPETMEHHVYRYLEHRYGVRRLAVPRAAMLVNALEDYASESNEIAVFHKIFCNECPEGFQKQQNATVEKLQKLIYSLCEREFGEKGTHYTQKKKYSNMQQRMREAKSSKDRKLEELYNARINGAICILEHEWEPMVKSLCTNEAEAYPLLKILHDLAEELDESNLYTGVHASDDLPAHIARVAEARGLRSKNYDHLKAHQDNRKPECSITFDSLLKTILDYRLRSKVNHLKPLRKYFIDHDTDHDGLVTPLQFRDVYDDVRHPKQRNPASRTTQAVPKSNAQIEDSLFFEILKKCDPHHTDRITFSSACGVYDEMRNNHGSIKQ